MNNLVTTLSRISFNRHLGYLIIRIALGAIFLTHGFHKVETIDQTMAMFSHMGFYPWVGAFIGWLEVIGGLMLVLGVATRVIGVVLGIEMAVAVFTTGFGRGFGGVEFEVLLSAVALGVALMGSGRYSVFPLECEDCGAVVCDDDTCVIAS